MGEIKKFVKIYVNKDIFPEIFEPMAGELQEGIKDQLYEGHGYDTGELHDSIKVDSRITTNYGILTGYYTARHGEYVLRGVRGKKKVKPIDFLGDGLEAFVRLYI